MSDVATVQIGGEIRAIAEADESWITQQVNRRQRDGVPVCVIVTIRMSGIDMTLATPACTATGGGGRAPNTKEQQLFNLWRDRGLN